MVCINLLAPCLVPAQVQLASNQLLQHLLAEDERNLGLVLLPVWSHRKNGRQGEEAAILKEMSKVVPNIDNTFSLLFANRCDTGQYRFVEFCAASILFWLTISLLTVSSVSRTVGMSAR